MLVLVRIDKAFGRNISSSLCTSTFQDNKVQHLTWISIFPAIQLAYVLVQTNQLYHHANCTGQDWPNLKPLQTKEKNEYFSEENVTYRKNIN